jgi:hypothetical protein
MPKRGREDGHSRYALPEWKRAAIDGWKPFEHAQGYALERARDRGDRFVTVVHNGDVYTVDVVCMVVIDDTGGSYGGVTRSRDEAPHPPTPARMPKGTLVYHDACSFVNLSPDVVRFAEADMSEFAVRVSPRVGDRVTLLGGYDKRYGITSQWGSRGFLMGIDDAAVPNASATVRLDSGFFTVVPMSLCGKLAHVGPDEQIAPLCAAPNPILAVTAGVFASYALRKLARLNIT